MMRDHRLVAVALVVLLVALFAQAWTGVRMNSPTFDEPYHIVRSYVYLKTGDSSLIARGGHPPFANLLHVLPLLFRDDIRIPDHQPGWTDAPEFKDLFRVADEFLWRVGNDVEAIMVSTRLTVVLLSLALALLVFCWARELYGVGAGLIAVFLYVFDPNVIAHSSVVTTDLSAALSIMLSVYCLYRFCVRPSAARLVITGVAFGLAQATKFSALFLVPILMLLLLIRLSGSVSAVVSGSGSASWLARLWQAARSMLVIVLVGALVVWAVYGLAVRPLVPREDRHPVLDRFLPQGNDDIRRLVYVLAENLPAPAPAYLDDLAWLANYARAGHPSFLLGQRGVTGWWFYFPVALLTKTPIPTLLLLGAALIVSVRSRRREDAFLVVPMAVLFLASMFSSIDIGYRNIVPVLPFAFILIGRLAGELRPGIQRAVLAAMLVWNVAAAAMIYPHHLAYFNELCGGPSKGYHYLVDSNLDWGQDLKYLKQYMDERGIDQIYLNYFGVGDPAFYGIQYSPMPGRPPASGSLPAYYALSATSLQGVYAGGAAAQHWLAGYTPIDSVGYSILIYRLP